MSKIPLIKFTKPNKGYTKLWQSLTEVSLRERPFKSVKLEFPFKVLSWRLLDLSFRKCIWNPFFLSNEDTKIP